MNRHVFIKILFCVFLLMMNLNLFGNEPVVLTEQLTISDLNDMKTEIENSLKLKTRDLTALARDIRGLDNSLRRERDSERIAELTKEREDFINLQSGLSSEIDALKEQLSEVEKRISTLRGSTASGSSDGESAAERDRRIRNEQKAQLDARIREQKEQEARLKELQLEARRALQEELKTLNSSIKEKNSQIKEYDREIKNLVDSMITSIDQSEIDENNQKRSEFSLQRTLAVKDLNDLLNRKTVVQEELKVKDDGYELAEGTLNWSKIYDIDTIQRTKPGTWNISVVAKDSMNNYSEEKAINIKIDPKSDIPFLNVINPKPKARVPGNLMVVGTAFDDDEVGRVVMFLNDENTERECIGKDFWYYDLDTTNMEDGEHKLSFRVYDIKGGQSQLYEVPFILDRRVPLITVDTINSGAVVSGRKRIGGAVSDSNGIRTVEYSIDNRYSFQPVLNVRAVARGRSKVEWAFSLDTNQLPSGTQVVWIKATDNAGSEGFFPLTLIVDRESPVIGFNYPENRARIGDRFTVYGYAYDNVDIKDVKIRIKHPAFPDREMPVEIIPGNPFWKFTVDAAVIGDINKMRAGNCVITAKVVDVADNVVTSQLNLFIDPELEKPVVALKSIKQGDSFASIIPLYGTVSDNNEMKDVIVNLYNSVNEIAMTRTVDSKFSFSANLDVSKLPEGPYTVETVPRDFHVTGNPVKESIWIDRSSPEFDISKINSLWGSKIIKDRINLDFSVIKYGEMPSVKYEIVDAGNGNVIESADVRLRAGSAGGVFDAVPLALDFTKDKKYEGLKLIRLTAVDKAGKKSIVSVPVIIDTTAPLISDFVIDERTGMMEDAEIKVTDNQILSSIEISQTIGGRGEPVLKTIKPGETFDFVMPVRGEDGRVINYDYVIKAVDTAGLTSERRLRIRFKDTAKTEHILKITTEKKDNSIYTGTPVVFLPDAVINPDEIRYAYGQAPEGAAAVSVKTGSLDIPVRVINPQTGFYMIDISKELRKGFNIGENALNFSYSSEGSNVNYRTIRYFNDLHLPKTEVIWPPAYIPFNSDISVFGIADDDSGIVSVSAAIDSIEDKDMVELKLEPITALGNYRVPLINPLQRGEMITISNYLDRNGISIYNTGIMYKLDFPASTLPEGERNIRFKITDRAGKVVYRDTTIVVDRTLPSVNILTPEVDEAVNGRITVRGDAFDDTGIANVILKLNDRIIVAEGTKIWDALYDVYERKEFNASSESPIGIKIEVTAIDYAGNRKTEERNVFIDIKTDIPEVFINSPAVDGQRYTIDNIKFEGVALDDDGIDSIQYRLNYGLDELDGTLAGSSEGGWRNIIIKKEELPNWSVTIPSGHLKPGQHILEVRAYDLGFLESETKSISFKIDKENPAIEISGPPNGSYIRGLRLVNGKASDPNTIASVKVSTNNGWTFVPAEGAENWSYYLDSSTLPDGPLNFLIKATDGAGSESYSFSVYNIDNTPPELTILQPRDGASINNEFRIIGRAKDNIGLDKGFIKITLGERNMLTGTDEYGFVPLNGKEAWFYDINTKGWPNGEVYHLVVKMYDMAENVTERSIDFKVDLRSDFPVITLDQPQSGQSLTGDMIEFYGTAYDDDGIQAVWVEINGGGRVKAEGTSQWRYLLPSVNLKPGVHRVVVVAQEFDAPDGTPGKYSQSISRLFYVEKSGVVINITSHNNGVPVSHRPWLEGTAEYYERDLELKIKKEIQTRKYYQLLKKYKDDLAKVPEIDEIPVKKHEVMSEMRKYLAQNRLTDVYLSWDNGNTFQRQVGLPGKWMHRLQTQNLGEGIHMLQFKGVTASGKETLKYFKVKIDREKPVVIIDTPVENASVNESIYVRGSADDNNDIVEVKVKLQRYDKNLGKIPKFIEGLYLWGQVFGGPVVSAGFGFSFFDNIVRLEGLFGWIPTQQNLVDMGIEIDDPDLFSKELGWTNGRYEPRFSGFAAGGKLLASVIDIPFEFFLGEDAANFSVSVSIGAGFFWISGFAGASAEIDDSYYRQKRETEKLLTGIASSKMGYDPNKDSKVLAGFMYQIDFFKVKKYGILNNFALYFENSFYFIASEVQSELTPQFGFGIRNSLF